MSNASLAQAARQSLARGLEALQARDAPPALIDVAQPVARAIGVLVDIELEPEIASMARVEPVLDALRDGLRLLQLPEYVNHPAAARGMKAVAESLSLVLSIVRTLQQSAPAVSPPVPSPPAPPVSMRPALRSLAATPSAAEPAVVTRAVNAVMGSAPASVRLEAPAARAEPVAAQPEPPPPAREPLRAVPEPVPPPPEPIVIHEPAPAAREPLRAIPDPAPAAREPLRPAPVSALREPPIVIHEPPLIATAQPSPRAAEALRVTLSRPPVAVRRDVVVERDLRAVDAPLGAHSPSNFYTGLAGGDVVASGGLFVATYQVPKIGEKVLLKISMPGGYEFVAKAKVAWTRDVATSLNPGSARGMPGAPGFGAQFCEITEEGRRLIQRYVRNREPLFHEDAL